MSQQYIYMISDGLGETGELVAKAALSQFINNNIQIKRFPYISDKEHIREIIEEAKEHNSIIAYTLVVPEMVEYLLQVTEFYQLHTVDLLGPMLNAVASISQEKPRLEPGLIRRLDEEYFRKVDAINFAVKYDDGKDANGFFLADIIITGVSRASKTPLCMYLAHKSIRAANLPLMPEVSPPEEIYTIPKNKVFGLVITPESLFEIRLERLRSLGLKPNASYASLERIYEELAYAKSVMNKIGCYIIDVTNKAVEETANKILEIYYEGDKYGK